jgi:soluble lytic murein transglycosylase-like protein
MRGLWRKLLRRLAAVPLGCGKLPLLAALVLVGATRMAPALAEAYGRPPERAAPATPPDFELIDAVLAKRAPDLGLTLRQQLGVAIAEEARRAGYDPLLILAIINVESEFTEEAVSVAGAKGLMQIRPSTLYFLASKEGLRLSREEVEADPALCVRLGIRYLRQLHDRFRDLELALMAYNAGPGRLWQTLKEGDLEQFRGYPRAVRRQFRLFREGEGLGGDWAFAQREPFPREREAGAVRWMADFANPGEPAAR